MLELVRAGTARHRQRSRPEHNTANHAMYINSGLVHAWKCLTRGGPLWGIMLLATCAMLGSGQRKCRPVGKSFLDVALVCKQCGGSWLASVRAFCRIGMRRPEDWLMQVPFRRYMKEPGPICGSVSPQSEDRPSHKEIPIATDWCTSAHDRTDGRTKGTT